MGLKIVPASDLSTSAADASHVGVLDFGFLQAGESLTRSIRIANTGASPVNWQAATASDLAQVSPATGFLSPDEISDTIGITVSLPLEAESGARSIDLIFSTDNGDETTLQLDFQSVGVNVARDSQYPERASSFTDNISNVITRAAEPLRLLTFQPIPFSPGDNRVLIDFTQARHLEEGGDHRFITQSVEERLNPLNEIWGYSRNESVILGSFQAEMNEITAEFEAMGSTTDYMATARLYVGAEFEFPRTWGLFSVGRSPDFDQYKRTVYVVERRGEFWTCHNIITKFRGNEIAYTSCDLVQIEPRNMGSPDQYNPFAWTFRAESDKPYAMFTIPTPDLRTLMMDGSGSAALVS